MNTLQYRVATLADIDAMSAIRLAVTENVLSDPSRITRAMYDHFLVQHGRGWVCERGGAIIGFSIASAADDIIWALFVQPGYEGLGAGAALLRLATDWLFERGASCVTLSTSANTRADRFYRAQGWERGEMKDDVEVVYRLRRAETT